MKGLIKVNIRKLFIIKVICLIFGLSSCNGTIEDGSLGSKNNVQDDESFLEYDGIFELKAISDTRVEVYFSPHENETKSSVYLISYQGLDTPISVPVEILEKDYRGLYLYTVSGLDLGTFYYFTVQVKDTASNQVSNNFTNLTEMTFTNKTADFSGISIVEPSPGINALTSIQAFWVPATKIGSLVSPNEIDPVGYEVTLLQGGSTVTPEDFDNENVSDELRRVFLVSSDTSFLTIDSLVEDTNYFVRVRAIHKGFLDNPNDQDYKVEDNNKYINYKTPSSSADSLFFDSNSLSINAPGDYSGYYTINLNWTFPVGVYDHYRIYYTQSPFINLENGFNGAALCNGQDSGNSAVSCKISDYTNVSDVIAGLVPNSIYQVMLKVCQNTDCTVSKESIVRTESTIPGLIEFAGITKIDNPVNPDKLDEVIVHLSPLDLSTGVIDGLIISHEVSAGSFVPLNHPEIAPPTTGPSIAQFHYEDTFVKIRGLDADSGEQYCFQALPFLYDANSEVQVASSGVRKCITPEKIEPNAMEFLGANDCPNTGPNFVSVRWTMPTGGLYSHFEVIVKDVLPVDPNDPPIPGFSYTDAAIENDADPEPSDPIYTTYIVDRFNQEFTITGLTSNTQYEVGVRTYFNNGSGVLRNVLSAQTRFVSCTTPAYP